MKYIQGDDDDVHECNGKLVAQWGIAGIVDIGSFLFQSFFHRLYFIMTSAPYSLSMVHRCLYFLLQRLVLILAIFLFPSLSFGMLFILLKKMLLLFAFAEF